MTQPLAVSHAFHSPLMAPMLEAFRAEAERVAFRAPVLPLVSNVTGQAMADAPSAAYWVEHVSAPVRFADGLATLAGALGCTTLMELGPRPALLGLARAALPGHAGLPSLRPNRPEWEQMLESLGALSLAGSPVDWRRYDAPYHRRKTALPTYPFQRQRYWPDMLREAVAPVKAPSPPQQDMTASLGRVEWHAVPWPEPGALDAGRWLLLADDSGLATALGARLRAVGAEVIEVRPGVATGLNGACRHIAADDPEEWRRLFAAAGPLAGVVHLWGLDFLADPAIADLDQMLAQGIGPMLAAARHRKKVRNRPHYGSLRQEPPGRVHAIRQPPRCGEWLGCSTPSNPASLEA